MSEATQEEILAPSQIIQDGGTQSRAAMNRDTVDDYRQAIDDARRNAPGGGAWPFPPIEVYYDGAAYHLADGFHRLAAAREAGLYRVPAIIHQGTRRDAVLASVGANATHGLRRTNADKRRAVETLLRDAEWVQWSDREIARRCHISHPTVAAIRAEMVATGKITSTDERKYVHANGAETSMNTGNIGKSADGRLATPPDGWTKIKHGQCPTCGSFRGLWHAASYEDVAETSRLADELGQLVEAWHVHHDEMEPHPQASSAPAVALRYHWSIYHNGECNCGLKFWVDRESNCYHEPLQQPAEQPDKSKDIPLSTLAQLEYFARQGAKSSESIYRELADPTCSGYAMQMEWMAQKTGFSPAIIQKAAAHLATRPRQRATQYEIGLAIGRLMGQLAQGLDKNEAAAAQYNALMDLGRNQKHSTYWADLDLDNRLDGKPWAIGDLLDALHLRLRAMPVLLKLPTKTENAEPPTAPAVTITDTTITLYGDNGQTITRDLIPAPASAPAADPEAGRYDGYQRRTFVNEHGHTETAWLPVARPETPEELVQLRQASDIVYKLIGSLPTIHLETINKLAQAGSLLTEAERLFEKAQPRYAEMDAG